MRPSRVLTLLEPRLSGDAAEGLAWGAATFDASGPYFGDLALGVLPLLFAAAAWRDRRGRAALLLAGGAAILSFGRFLPGYAAAARRLSFVRYPEKWWLVATFALAAATAVGVDAIFFGDAEVRERARRVLLRTACGLALVCGSMLRCALGAEDLLRRVLWGLGLGAGDASGAAVAQVLRMPLVTATATLIVCVAAFSSASPFFTFKENLRSPILLASLLSVLFLGDAARRVAGTCPAGPPDLYRRETPEVALVRAQAGEGRFYDDGADDRATAERRTREAGGLDLLRPATSAVFGIRSLGENDVDRLTAAPALRWSAALARQPWGEEKARVLRAAGVSLVRTASRSPDPVATEEIGSAGSDRLVRIAGARPEFVLLPEGEAGSVLVVERRAARVVLRADVALPAATLWIGRTFDPNWRARADGRSLALRPADSWRIEAELPKGVHEVTLTYANPLFAAGAAVSLAALRDPDGAAEDGKAGMRLRRALPLLGAVLLAWLPYRAFFGSDVPVGRDLLFYFYPLKAHLAEGLSRGELPWVDRFRWGGVPLLGGPSAAPFDPANVLFLVLPLGAAMKAWMLLHLAVLVAGFAAFARRLGLAPAAAAVAGLVFALAGTTVSVVAFPPTLSALSLLPWFAAFVLDTVRAPSARTAAKVAAAAALIVLASAPEFLFYGAAVALLLVVAAPPEPSPGAAPPRRGRAVAVLAGAAALAAGLAAVALVPAGAAAARSIRAPGGGMSEGAAALEPLEPARLKEFLADGLVADWTRVFTARGVTHYPYLPSLTPGRVGWLLVLLGLARRGPLRAASAVLVAAGALLALAGATPVFHLAVKAVPFLGSLRYPERHATLAGFGLATLAALGLARLDAALSPRARRAVLPLLALAVLVDRERIARGLSPVEDASVLSRPPALLEAWTAPRGDAPPPRIFHRDLYAPVPAYDTQNLAASGVTARASLLPAYASLFGAGYIFEKDYDLSLSVEVFEWMRLFTRATPAPGPLPLRIVRAAGASAVLASERAADGRYRPRLLTIGDPVPPFRFAGRVVASNDAPAVFKQLLDDGADAGTAYVDAALPGFPAAPSAGRILALRDRPSGLSLDVEVDGPAEGFLMLWRVREAVEEAAVDGRKVETVPMAFGFAGVRVPPGRHALALRPETRWVKIGSVIRRSVRRRPGARRGPPPPRYGRRMKPLSRNTRRRLALYGGAALVAAALWALPGILARRQPPVPIRRLDLEAVAGMETPEVKLLAEVVRLDTSNPPGITRPVVDVFARELRVRGDSVRRDGARPRASDPRRPPRGPPPRRGAGPPRARGRRPRRRPVGVVEPSLRRRARGQGGRGVPLRAGRPRHEGPGRRESPRVHRARQVGDRARARRALRRGVGGRVLRPDARVRLAPRAPSRPRGGSHGRLQRGRRQRSEDDRGRAVRR